MHQASNPREVYPKTSFLYPDQDFKVMMDQKENFPVSEVDTETDFILPGQVFEVFVEQKDNSSVAEGDTETNLILLPDQGVEVSMDQEENSLASKVDTETNFVQPDEDFEVLMDQKENSLVSRVDTETDFILPGQAFEVLLDQNDFVQQDKEASTPKQDKDAEASTDQHSAGHPTSTTLESVSEEGVNQLGLFVTTLAVKVFKKCNALEQLKPEDWAARIKRLVSETMKNLAGYEDFCPDFKYNKKIRKAVLNDLMKEFESKKILKSVFLQQDPSLEAAFVQAVTAHVVDLSAKQKKKPFFRFDRTDVFHTLMLGVVILAILIPLILL